MCRFKRAVGIDYSGAETPDSRLQGLRVFMISEGSSDAREVPSPTSGAKYWTRRELAQWLKERLNENVPTIVGIDHAFSFPQEYFTRYRIPYCWDKFLDDFCDHWPTDQRGANIYHMRRCGDPKIEARRGDNRWKRQTEKGNSAKSVFHFDVPGQVATSTHAGLPFLRELRRSLPEVHFWPFDGWEIPHDASCKSCIVEAYPRLYVDDYEEDSSFTEDQRDAYVTTMWMRDADQEGHLRKALNPNLPDEVRKTATYEGWILGAEWPGGGSTDSRDTEEARRTEEKDKTAECEKTCPGHVNKNGQITVRNTGISRNHGKQKIYHIACSRCGLSYGTREHEILECKCPICGGHEDGI